MIFRVSNKIVAENYTKELSMWCKENLEMDNPEYIKKERMGLWTGNVQRKIILYERNGRSLILPFGCVEKLRQDFLDYSFYTDITGSDKFNYYSTIELYDYQEKAVVKAIDKKNGIIVAPCGAGKTQIGLEIIARLGLKTLWLTHTQDLMYQSMSRAKSVFGCSLGSYGTITGGKVNIGSSITFATVQTMAKLDLSQYKNEWGCVVVDECHRCVGTPTQIMQFYKAVSSVSCRYKFGLTATPKRSDGLEKSMFSLLGDIVYKISKEDVADTTCDVHVRFIRTGFIPDPEKMLLGDGTINYAALVDNLIHDEERFEFVKNIINSLDGQVIVLANRVEYLERLNSECDKKSICLSSLGNSKAAKAERKSALKKLNAGDEVNCVFATYQLAKEGLDVPNLKYIVFATPEKDETTVTQAAGRVGRKSDYKDFGTVIDFVDDFGMYNGWGRKRKSYYKKLEYDIIEDVFL